MGLELPKSMDGGILGETESILFTTIMQRLMKCWAVQKAGLRFSWEEKEEKSSK